jgi:hypothetical protein
MPYEFVAVFGALDWWLLGNGKNFRHLQSGTGYDTVCCAMNRFNKTILT